MPIKFLKSIVGKSNWIMEVPPILINRLNASSKFFIVPREAELIRSELWVWCVLEKVHWIFDLRAERS